MIQTNRWFGQITMSAGCVNRKPFAHIFVSTLEGYNMLVLLYQIPQGPQIT